ncbi:Double-stranded RNA-binding protein 7 [Bienertia sinuspersici]
MELSKSGDKKDSIAVPVFEIGGNSVHWCCSKNQKEAEIKAARTALLAIRSSVVLEVRILMETSVYSCPGKRKISETAPSHTESVKVKKPKKPRFKKKLLKQKQPCDQADRGNHVNGEASLIDDASGAQVGVVECSRTLENSAAFPDANHDRDGDNDQDVGKVIPIIDAPLSEQLDALATDSGITQGNSTTAVKDTD